ncbi:hypothetical protein IV203_022329 [Nitzschia inconspicua]|uniref:Uncharacterized protein n=1 Tax=Nitzschia inconspicua TaxID=303405 RepID=A0A9K3PEY5_9STRA|nr:hypothetical protein IV203_022329 [Nitzschia inconspicua]
MEHPNAGGQRESCLEMHRTPPSVPRGVSSGIQATAQRHPKNRGSRIVISETRARSTDTSSTLAEGEKAGTTALRNIIVAEETKDMWRQLRSLNAVGDQGITTIDVHTKHCKECTD